MTPSRVIARVSALGLVAALAWPTVGAAAEPRRSARTGVADGVSVTLPAGLSYERRAAPAGAELFVVADGGDVLAILTYRERADRAIPSAEQALTTHASELADLLGIEGRIASERSGLTLLGRARPTARMFRRAPAVSPAHGPRESGLPLVDGVAWVVAAEHETGRGKARVRRVVVASALHVAGSPNAAPFETIVKSLAVR